MREIDRELHHPIAQVVNLIPLESQRLWSTTLAEAERRLAAADTGGILGIDGSFALVAREGQRVRLARSLDRPLRYFLAKAAAGPVLVAAERIDEIARELGRRGWADQFHPPALVAVAEAIPFAELAQASSARLYALKGEIVARGVRAVLGMEMPVFAKRRFQHGSLPPDAASRVFDRGEAGYRRHFQALHAAGA
jgi:hypothetical protein